VASVKVGDRVLAPLSSFTWRERMVISAGGLSALPPDADPQAIGDAGHQSPDRGAASKIHGMISLICAVRDKRLA
jgi:hypothetical protein